MWARCSPTEFYARAHSVVFTSATIAAGDDFSHFARGVGLDRLERVRTRRCGSTSSYDFDNQMAVFVPTDIAAAQHARLPRRSRAAARAGPPRDGRLDAHAVHEPARHGPAVPRASSRTRGAGVSLIVQGRGVSRKRLRDEFVADEALSLFATKSFWEGFDAKGDTLRCVIVPRLPFGRPTDPLAQEREEREGRARVEPLYAARSGHRAQTGRRAAYPIQDRHGMSRDRRCARAAAKDTGGTSSKHYR